MKKIIPFLFILLSVFSISCTKKTKLFTADDERFAYMGRIDFSEKAKPKMWASAAQVSFVFDGSDCSAIITDEQLYGNYHNYLNIIVDGVVQRIKLKQKTDTLQIAKGLARGTHTVVIAKSTEAGIGYIQFEGVLCQKLLPAPKAATRKIESYGDSITSAMAADTVDIPCDNGEWYDQTNGYMSYAAITGRQLDAQYHLVSASGIGLIRSCCNMDILMPQVYDKISVRDNKIEWDFKKYQPDVVTICLGQNDGVQDSTAFCSAYVQFIQTLRRHYPHTAIICLSSPMADATLLAAQKKYLSGVQQYLHTTGDTAVHTFIFSKQYIGGCGYHPTVQEQQMIAAELTPYIRSVKGW
ncbi:MAG TPA: SGNH/GDSL hydrolase family protein [Ferruginibacter sp.]|nr:SGNH/GDSL hydrolase family protein [Ferruginibacter sp.]HMP20634.1 SGNH/GDSL hydrolase family protein [Ferruginibacter sp.]